MRVEVDFIAHRCRCLARSLRSGGGLLLLLLLSLTWDCDENFWL